jgi:regulator of sirC expression with transglutaminase-like and TPR domain
MSQLQSTNGLLRAAVAVSMHELVDVHPAEVERQVARISGRIRSRIRGNQRQALLAHLHDELFHRRSLRGNYRDYYASTNSYVSSILETGLGIPISLSLIYTVVARRLGLRADGVNSPGHFLVQINDDTGSILVDPFHGGRQLNREDARALIERFDDSAKAFDDQWLRPATHRQWISRILRNLVHVFSANDQPRDAAAMLELLALVDAHTV